MLANEYLVPHSSALYTYIYQRPSERQLHPMWACSPVLFLRGTFTLHRNIDTPGNYTPSNIFTFRTSGDKSYTTDNCHGLHTVLLLFFHITSSRAQTYTAVSAPAVCQANQRLEYIPNDHLGCELYLHKQHVIYSRCFCVRTFFVGGVSDCHISYT